MFRSVALGGKVGTAALSSYAASPVIKQRIAAVGLDPATYSGHSLRAGFCTSPAEHGAKRVEDDGREPPQVGGHAARALVASVSADCSAKNSSAGCGIGLLMYRAGATMSLVRCTITFGSIFIWTAHAKK